MTFRIRKSKSEPKRDDGFVPGVLILPPEVVEARRLRREAELNKTLEEVTEDIRRERIRRQYRPTGRLARWLGF
jgi:hypothetical protein